MHEMWYLQNSLKFFQKPFSAQLLKVRNSILQEFCFSGSICKEELQTGPQLLLKENKPPALL